MARRAASTAKKTGQKPKTTSRSPGRPHSQDSAKLSRNTIFRTALTMTRTERLQDLSIVMVAKKLGVTPALIHYYIGGRDWLTSGVMNQFYKEVRRKWPDETGDWEEDLYNGAALLFDRLKHYGGIAAYVVVNHQFRVFQLQSDNEIDYGVEVLERVTARVLASGLTPKEAGIYTHILLEFVMSISHGASKKTFPRDQIEFLQQRRDAFDPEKLPSLCACYEGPIGIDGQVAFDRSFALLLLGIKDALSKQSASSSPATAAQS